MDEQAKARAQEHLEHIRRAAAELGRDATLMEICGGHTNVIMKYGIRDLLPKNVRLISGPGCPVCVSAQKDIDCVVKLALEGVPVATYGDMMKVPGSDCSLDGARAKGGKIFEVYSTTEVAKLRIDHPDVIFFGVGFETTAPMTAYLLENDIPVYSVHKLVPPAMKALVSGELKIDGFIDPGHVSTVTGLAPYRGINVPQAISGFDPEQILRAIRILLDLIAEGKSDVVNAYPEAVKEEGNPIARRLLEKHFTVSDSAWRGLGVISASGLEVKDDALNAKKKYEEILSTLPEPKKTGCRCGEILKGLIEPKDCPLYARACTPENPQGACMVSAEGTCSISYHYKR